MSKYMSTKSDMYRIRAKRIIAMRAGGMTQEKIAKEMGLDVQTIRRSIDWARKEGIVEEYEKSFLADLVPEAMRVYAMALKENDTYVAKDVIQTFVKLGDRFSQQQQHAEQQTLQGYLAHLRHGKDGGEDGQNQNNIKTVEGEVIHVHHTDNGSDQTESEESSTEEYLRQLALIGSVEQSDTASEEGVEPGTGPVDTKGGNAGEVQEGFSPTTRDAETKGDS